MRTILAHAVLLVNSVLFFSTFPFPFGMGRVLKLARVVNGGGGVVSAANVRPLNCYNLNTSRRGVAIAYLLVPCRRPSLKFWEPEARSAGLSRRSNKHTAISTPTALEQHLAQIDFKSEGARRHWDTQGGSVWCKHGGVLLAPFPSTCADRLSKNRNIYEIYESCLHFEIIVSYQSRYRI
jgi:hypothetical protein